MAYQEPDEIVYEEPPIIQNSTGTQIELSNSVNKFDEISLAHGIYTFHSFTENSGNRIKVTVWSSEEDSTQVSNNPIIEISADDKIKVVHLFPLSNEEYSIGSDDKRLLSIIGNRMYNDIIQSKTLKTHSGR
jgi:hypothetical protein